MGGAPGPRGAAPPPPPPPPPAPQARKILGFSDGRTQAKHVQNIWKSHIPHSSGAGVGTVGDDVPPPPRQATLAARPGTKQKIGKTYVKPYALRARSLRRSRLVGVASILQIFFQKSLDSAQSTCARQFSYTKRKPPAGAQNCPFSRTFCEKTQFWLCFCCCFRVVGVGASALRREAPKRSEICAWEAVGAMGGSWSAWLAGWIAWGSKAERAFWGVWGGGSAPQARKILGFSDGRTQAKHMENIWKSHIPHSSGAGVGTVGDDVPPPPRQATLATRPGTKQKIGKTYVKPYALRARSLRRSRLVGVASILQIFFQKSLDSANLHARSNSHILSASPPQGRDFVRFRGLFAKKRSSCCVLAGVFEWGGWGVRPCGA